MIRKIWRWLVGPKHGLQGFDGTHHTCACGHNASDDWDLAKHLRKKGVVL